MKLGERIMHRLGQAGYETDGPVLNIVADIMQLSADEAESWTHRSDDAVRIPQVLHEASDHLRRYAKESP